MLYGIFFLILTYLVVVVLILIFLENALRPYLNGVRSPEMYGVLILIFLENALRLFLAMKMKYQSTQS